MSIEQPKASPIMGVSEQPASQAQREAGFYHAMVAMGLGRYCPRVDLILIDGRQYAAMEYLDEGYQTFDELRKTAIGTLQTRLLPLLTTGVLHRLALAEWCLGNGDSHARNAMSAVRDPLRLIDHGSALAGPSFDPAKDPNSYAPAYLRTWAPKRWAALPPDERLKALPRTSARAEAEIKAWWEAMSASDVGKVLERYGIDPKAVVDRFQRFSDFMAHEPIDLSINRLWAIGP